MKALRAMLVAAPSLFFATTLALQACAPRPRMCVAPTECGAAAACVAGRCLPDGGTPAIQSARRVLLAPVDIAFIRPGDGPSGGALPAIGALGREADGSSLLLLRFRAPMPKDAKIVEAYLLLDRSTLLDTDPTPIVLHAARIVEPWEGRSISWALLPRIEETRSPSTTVDPAGRSQIRLDVRALVQRWRAHGSDENGIAVVAENRSTTGMPFALTLSSDATGSDADRVAAPPPPSFGGFGAGAPATSMPAEVSAPVLRQGPRLELYVK